MASATRFTWKALEMSASSSELDNVPVEVLSRFLQRERAARKEAEHLLEERSGSYIKPMRCSKVKSNERRPYSKRPPKVSFYSMNKGKSSR